MNQPAVGEAGPEATIAAAELHTLRGRPLDELQAFATVWSAAFERRCRELGDNPADDSAQLAAAGRYADMVLQRFLGAEPVMDLYE